MNLLLSLFMLFTGAMTLTPNTEYYITASSCYVYEDASFDSQKLEQDENVIILAHGDKVTFKSQSGNFCLVKINSSDVEGYVYKYYLASNDSITYYPVFNASIREDSVVYDLEHNPTDLTVKKNQRVYLYEGFSGKEYTNIQFVTEDGTLYNGCVLTEKVKPDGVNRLLIVAIPLIAAIVTVVLSVVFIQKKKKRKKAKSGS